MNLDPVFLIPSLYAVHLGFGISNRALGPTGRAEEQPGAMLNRAPSSIFQPGTAHNRAPSNVNRAFCITGRLTANGRDQQPGATLMPTGRWCQPGAYIRMK